MTSAHARRCLFPRLLSRLPAHDDVSHRSRIDGTVRIALLLACALVALPALAVERTTVATVASPGNVLTVALDQSPDGMVTYRVARNGKPVIAESMLGIRLRNGAQLFRGFALKGKDTTGHDDTWQQPWGESRMVRDHYNELRARFVEGGRDRREMDVVFRVFDDGVGFRYEFPQQPKLGELDIVSEFTEFNFAQPGTAWWIPAGEFNRYEQLYHRTAIDEVGVAHTPMTVKLADGTHVSIHEAALVDYSAMWLQHTWDNGFRAQLAPNAGGAVVVKAPFQTPWRTLEISDRAGGLYESNLILNLNAPNKLGDVSWFVPSKYVGVWWGMHLGTETWGTGPQHGATTANVMRYIDFAAANGFRGVLVEGWNPGWDGDWFANGWGFDFTRPTADYDIAKVAAYAKSKGVHLIGHHETACAVSHYESQMAQAFKFAHEMGEEVVKTGYVCDAGQIERQDTPGGPVIREWHDGQWNVEQHLRTLEAAAKEHIAIDSHEPVKDTGLRRTYPNWVSREGARGMEYNAWGDPPNPPEHEANLVFTRMLSGPMDFTPGVLSLTGKGGMEIQTTLAKQLALYVVLYSPIQMAADLPENYAKHLDAFQFIKDVPTDWDRTLVPNGEVGDYVTIVRKDRNGPDWYLGSVTDENARALTVKLDFLEPGRKYEAQIYRDGDGADWHGAARFRFARETRTVTAADTLALKLAPGGGEAIRFKAL